MRNDDRLASRQHCNGLAISQNKQFSMQPFFYDVSRDITATSDGGMNVAYYIWGTQPSSHHEVIF
jgi:hypothetical protein